MIRLLSIICNKGHHSDLRSVSEAPLGRVCVGLLVAVVVCMALPSHAQSYSYLPAVPANYQSKVTSIVHHKNFSLLYDSRYNTPTWVAWALTKAHTYGSQERSDKFFADPSIPKGYRVDWYEYKDSNYDRGHMCPAGDNKWDRSAMIECFYMSNMCPQDRELNHHSWNNLEVACRDWARTEGTIYIVCGPVYKKGVKHAVIGIHHKIQVPEGFFKAVLSLRKGHEKAIAFYYDNNAKYQSYNKVYTTVDKIEAMTGLDLFANIPADIEKRVEATANIKDWK